MSFKSNIFPLISIELTLKSRIYALAHVLLGRPKLALTLVKGFIFPLINKSPLIVKAFELIDKILSIP